MSQTNMCLICDDKKSCSIDNQWQAASEALKNICLCLNTNTFHPNCLASFEKMLREGFRFHQKLHPLTLSSQVKPNYKIVPNGKITSSAKHKANGVSKKASAEEKEKGKDKEKEKEERSEKEEKREEEISEESRAEEQAFLVELYKYMKERDTPIERIPFLGFKQSE